MSVENLDVVIDGKVLTNQLSNSERNDATAASILESAIESPGKWIDQKENDSSDSVNDTNKTVKQTSDIVCENDVTVTSCEMCQNYELNLTKMQDEERNLKEQLSAAQHLVNRYQQELSGERLYRKEMETKTTTLCADNEKEVNIAKIENENCAKQLTIVDERCLKLIQEQRNNIGRLKERLSMMNKDVRNLSSRYLKLLGANRKCSTEMRDQTIELPQDIDQLQFLCLQLREELIETRAAKEHAEVVLRDEITTLETQRKEDEIEKRRIEDVYTERVNGVSQELGFARSQLDSMKDASSKVEEMNKRMTEYRKVIEDLEKQLQSVQKERADLEMTVAFYKQKCAALQQELDTSETVQKDFVKLSQNLQIELEKIRQAEQEVRWQFDEDVHTCNQCESNFSKSRIKLHCYHCGKIFCSLCLTATIPSGPHRRPAKVCQVCHTLLSRDSAPFFSQNLTAT
uniref:FYVE-type domain-containing protein n=1 Tax=Onchocerca volvulus TaxID=6282 RepID=A0A8R1Y3K0_ONCVO